MGRSLSNRSYMRYRPTPWKQGITGAESLKRNGEGNKERVTAIELVELGIVGSAMIFRGNPHLRGHKFGSFFS